MLASLVTFSHAILIFLSTSVSVKIRSIAEYLPVSHADHDSAYYFSNQGKGEIDSDQGRKLDEQSLERDEENRTYLWDAQKESVEGDIGDGWFLLLPMVIVFCLTLLFPCGLMRRRYAFPGRTCFLHEGGHRQRRARHP